MQKFKQEPFSFSKPSTGNVKNEGADVSLVVPRPQHPPAPIKHQTKNPPRQC